MHPVLFHLSLAGRVFELQAFGVMVALGLALGTVVAIREARLRRVDPELIRDLCLWGLASCLLGGRLVDVLANGRYVWEDCLDGAANGGAIGALTACTRPLWPWEGGLVFYGGVAGGLAAVWLFTWRHGMNLPATLDLLTPSVPLGHAVGRLGCFLAGCCWGKPAPGLPWSVSFPEGSAALREMAASGLLSAGATRTPTLHPTQLYEALGELVLFAVVWAGRGRTRFKGELALMWLAGYSTLRLFLEVLRGDPSRAWLVELSTPGLNRALGLAPEGTSLVSTSQGFALAMLLLAGALVVVWRRGAGAAPTRPTRSTGSPAAPAPAPPG